MRKMSASYSRNVVHDKDLLKNVVGFSSVSILRKKIYCGDATSEYFLFYQVVLISLLWIILEATKDFRGKNSKLNDFC